VDQKAGIIYGIVLIVEIPDAPEKVAKAQWAKGNPHQETTTK